jgi:uncharacterized membrane protein
MKTNQIQYATHQIRYLEKDKDHNAVVYALYSCLLKYCSKLCHESGQQKPSLR